MKTFLIILGVLGGVVLLFWLGLNIQPKALPDYLDESGQITLVPLPEDLPAPVERFFRELYGSEVPVIESVVISGKAQMRVNGLTFPGRFRFTHLAGQDYRHYIEATLFGFPLLKVSERYLDGISKMVLPFGTTEGDPKVNQGANLALWAEAMWFPAVLVTDPAACWEARGDHSAILVVPFEGVEERFVVRFDPETGLLVNMEAMRYKGEDSLEKTVWLTEAWEWDQVDGYLIPKVGAVTWIDEGSPWAIFTVDDLVINPDIDAYIRAEGP